MRSKGQVISVGITHVVPDRRPDYHVPHVGTFYLSGWGAGYLSATDRNCQKENRMFHLPVEVHWSHQCHIQTGRNSAQQWRQPKPRSRWPAGNVRLGNTRQLCYPPPISLQHGLLTGSMGWFCHLDITHFIIYPYVPGSSFIWDCGCLSFLLYCQSSKKSGTASSREGTKHPSPHVYVLSRELNAWILQPHGR